MAKICGSPNIYTKDKRTHRQLATHKEPYCYFLFQDITCNEITLLQRIKTLESEGGTIQIFYLDNLRSLFITFTFQL